MKLYKTVGFVKLAKKIIEKNPLIKEGDYKLKYFSNKEIQIILQNETDKESSVFLGTIAPPCKRMMESFLFLHTLKKEGAKNIIAIFPYLAYMRQDRQEINKSLMTDFVARTIENIGVKEIVTVDIHSEMAKTFFKIPIISLSPAKIFAEKIKELKFKTDIIVAPDNGAIGRAENLKRELKIKKKIIFFEKQRIGENIQSVIKDDGLGKRAIVVDDILDTGETLISCAKQLASLGVEEILIVVTHGLFTGKLWKEFFRYKVVKIITTDSISHSKKLAKKIETISLAPLLGDYLQEK